MSFRRVRVTPNVTAAKAVTTFKVNMPFLPIQKKRLNFL
jgi:hypothetical protein